MNVVGNICVRVCALERLMLTALLAASDNINTEVLNCSNVQLQAGSAMLASRDFQYRYLLEFCTCDDISLGLGLLIVGIFIV